MIYTSIKPIITRSRPLSPSQISNIPINHRYTPRSNSIYNIKRIVYIYPIQVITNHPILIHRHNPMVPFANSYKPSTLSNLWASLKKLTNKTISIFEISYKDILIIRAVSKTHNSAPILYCIPPSPKWNSDFPSKILNINI